MKLRLINAANARSLCVKKREQCALGSLLSVQKIHFIHQFLLLLGSRPSSEVLGEEEGGGGEQLLGIFGGCGRLGSPSNPDHISDQNM